MILLRSSCSCVCADIGGKHRNYSGQQVLFWSAGHRLFHLAKKVKLLLQLKLCSSKDLKIASRKPSERGFTYLLTAQVNKICFKHACCNNPRHHQKVPESTLFSPLGLFYLKPHRKISTLRLHDVIKLQRRGWQNEKVVGKLVRNKAKSTLKALRVLEMSCNLSTVFPL